MLHIEILGVGNSSRQHQIRSLLLYPFVEQRGFLSQFAWHQLQPRTLVRTTKREETSPV